MCICDSNIRHLHVAREVKTWLESKILWKILLFFYFVSLHRRVADTLYSFIYAPHHSWLVWLSGIFRFALPSRVFCPNAYCPCPCIVACVCVCVCVCHRQIRKSNKHIYYIHIFSFITHSCTCFRNFYSLRGACVRVNVHVRVLGFMCVFVTCGPCGYHKQSYFSFQTESYRVSEESTLSSSVFVVVSV